MEEKIEYWIIAQWKSQKNILYTAHIYSTGICLILVHCVLHVYWYYL